MEKTTKKIWFITGISSGFGQALARKVIAHGDFVIGTFRQGAQVNAFNAAHPDQGLGLQVDVTNTADLEAAFQTIAEQFGRLDVLVNNAGIGFAGAIEEANEAETRRIMEVNFFGALRATQLALPIMRRQRSGHIFQISSGAGIKATAGFGIYNAAKFALEGFSEALADEVKSLGIHVTIVQPGPFRTEFAGGSLHQAEQIIEDYAATAGTFRQRLSTMINGKQEGDPDKAADIIIQVAEHANPPLRLPLGKMVLGNIKAKLNSVQRDLDAWGEVAASAVF